MALSLSQLLAAPTVDNWRTMLLAALQGLGIVVQGGTAAGSIATGTGSLTLSGTPAAAYTKIIIKVVTAGELGAGVFQYSLDGGATYSGNVTIPAAPGAYSLSTTGVTITFVPGPAGGGTSFQVGDTFSFALATPALQVTAWPASGAFRQLVEIEAQALASLAAQQAGLAAGGFTTRASGSWCDLLGTNFYSLTRNPAAATAGQVTITDAASAGPFTIVAGQLTFASTSGYLYSNTNGGVLNKGGTLALQVAALAPGAAYNVGINTITSIVGGQLPGVTVNNPVVSAGTWTTALGADAESDSAYMLRCQQRWPTLGTGSPATAYQLWATLADATVSKTLVQQDAAIAGQIDIYLAGAGGTVGGAAVTNVQNYITPRVALPATISVQAAAAVALTVAGTVNYYAAQTTLAAITAAVAAALAAYVNPLAIGTDAAGNNVKAYYTELLGEVALAGALAGVPVVRNVTGFLLNGGTADIGLTVGQVATLTNSLTFTAV